MAPADSGDRREPPAAAAVEPVGLARKIAFLRSPSTFPDRPAEVETVETHFAYVFMSQRLVYKLKKPHRFRQVDFTSVAARRANCELEAALNRRLAEPVYIGVVPLTFDGSELAIDGPGDAVDWLVHMHRLPQHRTLERLAAEGRVTDAELRSLIDKLNRFYRAAVLAPWGPEGYRRQVERRTRDTLRQLRSPELGLDASLLDAVDDAQMRFLDAGGALLEARARERRIVDAHGDLRPEHVFLDGEPQIIDCLEFSQELRWLDSAEEISFLALECERLAAPAVAQRLLDLYVDAAADPIAPGLLAFYRSARAAVRALLSAWHTVDGLPPAQAGHWIGRATWYLEQARSGLARAGAGPD
ncbi:MAG: hypothetical protein JXB36_00740 [Gammaproteobacteria bacterium]|nr:hypothetical protein [Gammaproteobacteria bacterium]